MNTALKLLLALAALVLLAGAAVFLWLHPSSSQSALERDLPAAQPLEAPRNAPVESSESLAAETPSSERSSMPKEPKAAPATGKPAAAAEAEVTVVAHIVDENLRPIANAWLRPTDDYPHASQSDPKPEARTGTDGIATLHWKAQLFNYPLHFVAGAEGYALVFPRGTLKAGETLHLGDLTLRRGGSVRGRVVDSEQHPVAGAQVVVSEEHTVWGSNDLEQLRSRGPEMWMGAPESKSAQDGSFLVEGVAVGMTRAWAKTESMRWAVSAPLEVTAGNELRDVVLVLDPEDKADAELRDIEGIVVDPNEKPIPTARMQVRQSSEGSSWSNGSNAEADGRFRVHPRERGVHITLEFSDPEERYTAVKLEDVKPGTKELVIRLEEARTILLSARDEHGPVEKFRVHWGLNDWDTRAFVDKDEAHADGRATLKVPTKASFYYQVIAPGHKPEKLGPLDGAKLPAELAVKLVTIPGIRGRVMAGDKPVSGAKVALFEQPKDTEIEMNGFTTLVQTNAEMTATSDSEGLFALDLNRDGNFTLFTDADSYARAQYGPALLEASKGLQDLVIQIDVGGTLEGKVLMPPGRSPAGVIVGINRGDARPFTQTVGPDGAFRFERLSAGAWELERAEEMFHGPTSTSMSSGDNVRERDIRHDFTIAVGQTTHMDLDLRNANPCVLEIDLKNNGQPARAWSVVVWPKGRHTFTGEPPSAATDSNGHARVEVEDPGECSITVRPPAESGSEFDFHATVTLQRGPNNWGQDVLTGRVEGAIAGWQPDAAVKWRLLPQNVYSQLPTLHPDAAGHFAVAFMAAGSIQVQRTNSAGEDRSWETVQSFALAGGETKTLQLP